MHGSFIGKGRTYPAFCLLCNMSIAQSRIAGFSFKFEKMKLGIAFSRKIEYLNKNEMLEADSTVSTHRYWLNEEVP